MNEDARRNIDRLVEQFWKRGYLTLSRRYGTYLPEPAKVGTFEVDIVARYKRMKGFNVLHPMGWDAFGLPAEQYAIETGTHPSQTTQNNCDNFRRQIKALGLGRTNKTVEVEATPQILGMVQKVSHLVSVSE